MKTIVAVLLCGLATSHALYSSSDDVIELTPSNFQREVIQSDDLWLVEFYAPWCGHCKSLAPEWKKAASALKGVVKIGAVDADAHNSLGGQYGVRGFPTIKIFGSNKNSPTDYQGARQAQGIVDSAMSSLKSMVSDRLRGGGKKSSGGGNKQGGGGQKAGDEADVIELTDSNFDSQVMNSEDIWLVEFFAPWCGHCKNLAPEWAKAASNLKGKVKVAAVDATVHSVIANRFGVYPTILLFPDGNKNVEKPEQYLGGHSAPEIMDWVLDRYLDTVSSPDVFEVRGYPTIKFFPAGKKSMDMVEDFDGGRTASDIISWGENKFAENVPPPEVHELTDESVLKKACDESQLCIISFLPHILDCQSKCRNDHLAMLRKLGDKYKKRVWGWVWAEGATQPAVEEAMDIGGFGYPAMVAVNSRKKIYSVLKGSFSEEGINEFLRALAVGRGSTAPLRGSELPKVEKREPWDGKDGELPEEEDIDLSDVFLDDLDDEQKDEL